MEVIKEMLQKGEKVDLVDIDPDISSSSQVATLNDIIERLSQVVNRDRLSRHIIIFRKLTHFFHLYFLLLRKITSSKLKCPSWK